MLVDYARQEAGPKPLSESLNKVPAIKAMI
jgi:hypothetical protein